MADLLFVGAHLSDVCRELIERMKQRVEHADPPHIQTQEIENLVTELSARSRIEPLELLENEITVDQAATKIDVAGRFEYAWDEEDGPLLIDGIALTLHVPYRGDADLLRLRPSRSTFNPPRADVGESEITMSAAGPPQDAARIQAHLKSELEALKQHAEWSRADVMRHNAGLATIARTMIEDRRRRLSQMPDLTTGFGFPIRSVPPKTPLPTPAGGPERSGGVERNVNHGESAPGLLHVFLCHASQDKAAVRTVYDRLKNLPLDLWLDEVKLLPGQDWEREIRRALREAHVVIVCLSHNAVSKEGFVQKEIRIALDIADEKPEGTIFVIPARLDTCDVPQRLVRWQWVDLFEEQGVSRLISALRKRARDIDVDWPN